MEDRISNLTMGQALIGSAVIALVYYLAAYDDGSALEQRIASQEQSYQSNKLEIERVRKAIEDAERYQQTMASLGSEIERIQRAMPQNLPTQEMMRLISNEAKVVGLEINQISSGQGMTSNSQTDPNAAEKFYESVAVEISLKGTYNQVMLFLSNLTKTDKIIMPSRLVINASGKQNEKSALVEVTATLEAYKYVAPKAKEPGQSG